MAEDMGILPSGTQDSKGLFSGLLRHHHQHSHSHIEGVIHVVLRDLSLPLDHLEKGWGLLLPDHRPFALRQSPRDIFIEPSPGDVGNGAHRHLVQQLQHRFYINFCGGQQRLSQRLSQIGTKAVQHAGLLYIEHPAHQREAIGVDTAGG